MTKRSDGNDRTALYRYFDADGRLLYLGITNDPSRRDQAHKSKSKYTWYPLAASREVKWYATRSEAEAAETAALAAEQPPWNTKGTAGTSDEARQAQRARRCAEERYRTVRVPVGRPAEAAKVLRKAMTDGELACLMDAFKEMGADKIPLPELLELHLRRSRTWLPPARSH